MSAKDAENSFGLLIGHARAAPIRVDKHGRSVMVVIVEQFERLNQSMRGKENGDRLLTTQAT